MRNLTDSPKLARLRSQWKSANESDADQAERERDDIAFENDEQWPVDVLLSRQAQSATGGGLPAVPARPTLVINKVKEPVRQVCNQERASDLGISLTPADDFGDLGIVPDDTEIELREGLLRQIQRDSIAQDARSWAFKRAVIAGRGFYLVMTRYLPGRTSDQEVYIHRIYNQDGVKLDPAHEQPDGSDAEWGAIGTWVPWARFSSEYGTDADGKELGWSSCSDDDFLGLTESYPDWYQTPTEAVKQKDGKTTPGRTKAVRVVDFWEKVRVPRKLATTIDGKTWYDEPIPADADAQTAMQYLPADTPDAAIVDRRTINEIRIEFTKLAGGCVEVERTDWPGQFIPIVKVLGDEVLPYDEQRRYVGLVRPARSSNMGLNYMVSKVVETIGLSKIPDLSVDPDAIDGYEEWWKAANTRTLPYLPSRSYDDAGRQLREASRLPSSPDIAALMQSTQMFAEMIKSTTAVPDSTLGNVNPSIKSGKAIQALVQNAALSTSNFLDNLSRSMNYEARIINDLLYPIYGTRPGRLVRVMTGENEADQFTIGDQAQQQLQQQALKVAKLTKDAHFNIVVKLTKNSESKRQQEASELGQLISDEPSMMAVFGDLYFRNSDMPNRNGLADRAKAMLAPPIQQLLAQEAEGMQPDPASAAKMAQMGQQLQQASQAVQQLQMELQAAKSGADVAQIKAQADVAIAQMKDATDRWKTALTQQTQAAIGQEKIDAAHADTVLDAQAKVTAAVLGESGAAMKQMHDQAHEAALATADAHLQTTHKVMDQQHAAEQAAQQAALQPQEPTA